MTTKMTKEELQKLDEEIQRYIENGTYPAANQDIIKKIADCKLNDKVKDENKYIMESYYEQLDKLLKLDYKLLKQYLAVLKNADIKDNQCLEKVDSFLLSLHLQSERKHAVDEVLKADYLNHDILLKTHGLLLKGTPSSEFDNYHYRKNNRKFVGSWEGGKRNIQYLPLDYHDIDQTMDLFFEYYNEEETNKDNLFIKPFAIHGMIAALQVFEDGNTRLARLLQHTKLYKLTNQFNNYDIPNPILYVTRAYYPHRNKYRSLIKDMVVDANDDTINDWMLFNLRRLEETLWKNDENINRIKLLKR